MFDQRHPFGWLFYLLFAVLAWPGILAGQTPALTTISDVVYRADGTLAGGTLLISWPTFSTATGQSVAAGMISAPLGPGGTLSVGLVPNAPGTFYTVVYQLDDETVKTEFWVVTSTSPTTIAAVRTVLGSGNSAAAPATQQLVEALVAGKADDAVVVHKSGSEAVAGVKTFSSPPDVPTPVLPTDAVNKAYVDAMVATLGGGAFVLRAGDTMTGPLQLPADPVSPNQASDKHYVDAGLAAKAGLVGGVVPTSELGNGVANNTLCLHGDSSWGGCGSSSNAVSIQNVPVDPTAPTDNQVITYVASAGKYVPRAGSGVTAGMAAVKYSPDFNWSLSPATSLATAGAQTVNLTACAAGVTASEPQYFVYVSGTGTAEAVLVTGGTCAGDGQPGTLQFTTTGAHPAGYTIGSASGGLQETLIAARFTPTNPTGSPQSGKVIVPPGEYKAFARVSIRSSNITVDLSGSIVECWMADTCIFVGDPTSSVAFEDITLINPRGRPTVVNGQKPFIEVNAQKTRLFNVSTRVAFSGGTFSSYVQVDNDQAFLLDGLDTGLGGGGGNFGVRCDATVCNPVIYAPGPFASAAAVGWLKHLNIALQCAGNGIDWQSGNTVRISDSVIEGFAQYGVRAGTRRGGFGGFELANVYEEVGECANPLGAIGQAGVISQGATVKIQGGEAPVGAVPQFANTGSIDLRYYIVAHQPTNGPSNPLYAGNALSNGSGNITVTTPDISGASTFDLLRVSPVLGLREQAPYGTGNFAVATSVARSSACVSGVCTFTDTQASLQSYTVAPPTYFPLLDFWPGNLILGTGQDSGSALDAGRAWMDNAPSDIVAVQGSNAPAVIATNCDAMASWTPLWVSCYSAMAPAAFFEQGAFLLAVKPNADAGLRTNLKGRLNFSTLGTGPGHIITLSDSNFQKTIATANNRPTNDPSDAFIGYDQGDGNPVNVGISMGAPVSISNYIGNAGDGLTLKFYLSQTPFSPTTVALVDEEYAGTALDPTRWIATDPSSALTVSAGKLQVAGGTGLDGQTTVTFAEKIELGGALVLQHGDVVFNAPSNGVLGGLYPAAISAPGCLAGFRIMPSSGGQSSIQALVSGLATGTVINTIAGHHYAFTTRFYSTEIYREQQTFHSAAHPAGSGFGGGSVAADLRVVLEVHQTDPANPATLIASSTILYDGVIGSVGGFCAYALVNAFTLDCTIPFTRIQQPADVTVRSAIPGQSYRTRLVGLLTDGAECAIVSSPALSFFPQHAPVSNELIEVQYRGPGRGLARVTNAASILAQQEGSDDEVRGSAREVAAPSPRTSADCENAALALLDVGGTAWAGAYETWGDFLPGNAADIFPGDAVSVNVPSRNATFQAIVREVSIEIRDLRQEHIFYTIQFADDVAAPLAFVFQAGKVVLPLSLISMTTAQVGSLFLPSLTGAEITQATSTTVSVDAGVEPGAGGGIEVRWSDFGWGQANDRNLAGRFSTRTFNLTRLAAVQNYFLRQFDNSTPPRYSRYTTALHLKFPL